MWYAPVSSAQTHHSITARSQVTGHSQIILIRARPLEKTVAKVEQLNLIISKAIRHLVLTAVAMESNLSCIPLTKKQKLDCANLSPADECLVEANDFVKLVFVILVSNGLSDQCMCVYHHFRPTYSHQIFSGEKINFLSEATQKSIMNYRSVYPDTSGQLDNSPGLLVYIKCDDLTHYVTTRKVSVLADAEMLLEKISVGLPASSHGLNSPDCATEFQQKFCQQTSWPDSTPPGKALPVTLATPSPCSVALSSSQLPGYPFEMYLASATDSGAADLLHRAEKVAAWYIETADSVDFSDERWEVLNLYSVKHENHGETAGNKVYSFSGYMTLFTFMNPFLGSKIRVCQALVLPHMQGKGLGRMMLLAVYNLAKSRPSIVEVTVEDPAPAFERLRDATDCEWLLLHLHEENITRCAESSIPSECPGDLTTSDPFEAHEVHVMRLSPLIDEASMATPSDFKDRCKELKLIPSQVAFALEALQYAVLIIPLIDEEKTNKDCTATHDSDAVAGPDYANNVSPTVEAAVSSSASFKAFRLRVKRRMLNSNKHLRGQSSEVMQKELEALFKELTVRYTYCLKSIRRIKVAEL